MCSVYRLVVIDDNMRLFLNLEHRVRHLTRSWYFYQIYLEPSISTFIVVSAVYKLDQWISLSESFLAFVTSHYLLCNHCKNLTSTKPEIRLVGVTKKFQCSSRGNWSALLFCSALYLSHNSSEKIFTLKDLLQRYSRQSNKNHCASNGKFNSGI